MSGVFRRTGARIAGAMAMVGMINPNMVNDYLGIGVDRKPKARSSSPRRARSRVYRHRENPAGTKLAKEASQKRLGLTLRGY